MQKLAIIGASYLQKPLVERAKSMGIETHCFAWDDDAVCKSISDYFYPVSIIEKEEILNICKTLNINGILTIASDTAVPTVCYVAEKLNLLANSYSDAIACTNKFEMRKRFAANNVLCPRFQIYTKATSFSDFRFPVIVKPVDRSGSRGVSKINSIAELDKAVEYAIEESFTKQAIVEEYITGVEVSVETISWKGEHFVLAVTDKVTSGEPNFVELEHHQPSRLNALIIKKIKTQTIKTLNALNVKFGASHAEFIITNTGDVYAIETGARMGGDFIGSDLVKLSTGYDFVEAVINISLGNFTPPSKFLKKHSGVFFITKETQRLLTVINETNNQEWLIEKSLINSELKSPKSSSDRSGYIIYQSENRITL